MLPVPAKRKFILALALALVMALAGVGPAHAKASIYVGAGHGYFVAFEIQNGHPYVLALTDTTYCHGTGAHRAEHVGVHPSGMFAAPARMRKTREGFRGTDEVEFPLWREHAVVQAKFRGRRAIVGTFTMAYEERETECRTGGYGGDPKVSFTARKYIPVGSHVGRSRALLGEAGVYFSHAGFVETLIRWSHGVLEIRGAVRQRCRIPASETDPPTVPLLSGGIDAVLLGDHGGFRAQRHYHGGGRRRGIHDERISMTGRFKPDLLTGRYFRVKVRKRVGRVIRRCETGPVRFRAKRYVRAR
jgi:hypothetical protein